MKQALVSVVMITYNHEKYIQQAIEGVLMQQANFPVELIIADDASPDQTENIVNKIKAVHPNGHWIKYTKHYKNKGVSQNFIWALKQAQGKYIALCEGDDYWTDPYKLQKQVDFLGENNEYGLVHTQINKLFDATNKIVSINKDRSKTSFVELLKENPIATLTTVMRKDLLFRYIEEVQPQTKNWIAGDTPMWLWFSIHSKIYFLNEITAVYRVRFGSVSNVIGSKKYLDYIQSRFSIKKFFIDKYYDSNNESLNIIYYDYFKNAYFHALKIRDKKILKEIIEYNNNTDKKIGNENFLKVMSFLYTRKLVYTFIFNLYRAKRKIF